MRTQMCIMRRSCWIVFCVAVAAVSATQSQTIPKPDIRSLMAQLKDPTTIGRDTEKQILELAKGDPEARDYVVQTIPEIIRSATDDPWLIAVRLAGKLKAKEAIPALQQAMSRRPLPAEPYITSGGSMRLDNDIVAKSLAQIGNPAIPSVVTLLSSADVLTRSRAVLILRNMGSPAARRALQNRLPHETDPEIKKLIEDSLHS
jgi:HEAT repeat protein